jgi:carbonic anhydrase/acetyltransferase-like protein (isoleucine patch superfamily)
MGTDDPEGRADLPEPFVALGAVVVGDVRLGTGASVWYNAVARGDTERVEVGRGTNIQDLSMLHADPGYPCVIGERVTVGHRAILHGCVVEDDCLIGMGAIVLTGAVVGRGSIVGAGALVTEGTRVEPGSLVVGAPARRIRDVDEEARARINASWRHYVELATRHRTGEFPTDPPGR